MMKLRHLVDNRDLVFCLLNHWGYDKDKLDTLNRFRISANAVYPFYRQGELLFLRFSPITEKSEAKLLAELHFLVYLRENGLSVSQIVPSVTGDDYVFVETAWGNYIAVVFKQAKGKRMDGLEFMEERCFQYGKTLGTLHQLSQGYQPVDSPRPDWQQQLDWVQSVFDEYAASQEAICEVEIVRAYLKKLPITTENYGLIHYDYELDNVFYDQDTDDFTVIDFDDALYHWFAADVVASMQNLREEYLSANHEQACTSFLMGYRSVRQIATEELAQAPAFERFSNLYQYARCLRATQEKLTDEPEWMLQLRKHLANIMARDAVNFGKPIG